jgi:outer membrane protein OmpA-like peptidoglycan-associated protein
MHYRLVDPKKSMPATASRAFYVAQLQKTGAVFVSNPKNQDYAVLTRKTPQAEQWFIYEHIGGDATTDGYRLTTVQIAAIPKEVKAQQMPAALDPLAPCGNPPWLVKAPAHFRIDSCDNRLWDSMSFDTTSGSKTLEGPRTIVVYKLEDEKEGKPSIAMRDDFAAGLKAIGATILSNPKNVELVVATQKTPKGEFWFVFEHHGDNDTTGTYLLTTIQVMPDPQFVQTQPMKTPLDAQPAQCGDPPWLVKQFPQYKIAGCNNVVRDSVSVDTKDGSKTIEGPRTAVTYSVTDDKKVETALGVARNYQQAFQAMGATVVSDLKRFYQVVATQKTPAGEFWYIYDHGNGNEGSTGTFTLTTVQVTAFDQEVKVQPMTAPLDTLAKCSDPAWLMKQFPQYKVDSCENRNWDVVSLDLPTGSQTVEGARTTVVYRVTDDKKSETALTVHKNYVEAFKAIGVPLLTKPDIVDDAIMTSKSPAGEFWFIYSHGSGNSESTASYSLTTVQVTPFPQIVQAQLMAQGLTPQSKPCRNPDWLVKQFSYFNISQCSWRDFDQLTLDLPSGKKTIAGRILVTDFLLADQNQTPTALYVYRNYLNALQAIGAQLVSDPKDHDRAVFDQTTPQGEFWYIYSKSTGNEESVGSYELTTVQIGGPPPKPCTLEIYGVNFDFNKASLRPDSEPVLNQVLALFTADPAYAAEVGGHTDNIGTESYNMKLSGARAAAVKTWLVAHGIAAGRITTQGYGDTRPLVPNTTDANRFKNRRVELKRQNCK